MGEVAADFDSFGSEVAFLKRAVVIGRAGPWWFYPGIAKVEMSPEWVELFSNDKPPRTFPEYLSLIDPDDRSRIAMETKFVFLMGEVKCWKSTFRRSGQLILARALAISPGHVIGVDIDIT